MQLTTTIKIRGKSKSVVGTRVLIYGDKDVCLVQPIWIVCLDEIVKCVVSREKKEKINENVKNH